ncbi:cache domain-containing protein [Qaidamihabitans albus]|uniref:cache domain-containing protein n=1 Tax=Qaidamihabitans albus TaxID=2795733 RepID=UPI0018F1D0D8|nr:cache domain-containing protein [Qaidamihabitans albus]
MKDTRTLVGDDVADHVSALVEGVFTGLDPVLSQADALFAGADRSGVRAEQLERLRPEVLRTLGGHDGLVVGAGFIAAPNVLADQEFGFEWWTRTDGGRPTQLFISLDPASDHFLDYTRQSWFTVPRDTGHRHITGPYVDYLCTDEYTMTFTVPVRANGAFAGVVGADVFVREFEHLLQPRLRGLPGRAALVNAQGRVIVSNSARQPTGSLVRALDIPAWWGSGAEPVAEPGTTLRRCGDAPIALLVSGNRS